MIGRYANQTLSWQHVSSVDEYNEPTYTTTSIAGRMETGNKLVRDQYGQEVVSTATVYTESAVDNGDLIEGKIVIQVNKMIGFDGNVKFYEVNLA